MYYGGPGRLLLREDQCHRDEKGSGAWGTLETQDYSDLKDGAILYLGYLQKGERVTLTNGDDTDDTPKVSAEAYVMNEEALAQAVEILSKEHLENVAMDSTHISEPLSLKEAGRLIPSVPYEEGWTVQIDGEKMQRLSSLAMRSWHLIWKRENIRYRCTMYRKDGISVF